MQIAPGVDATAWLTLKLDAAESADWSKAIKILQSRIYDRYIAPVDFLVKSEENKLPSGKRCGFVVLAIDCLLIETLAAFIDGLEDTEGESKATFCKFLMSHPLFAKDFPTGDLAKQFYREFRCGILHQAEVGGESKVWSIGPLLQVDGGRIIVNRTEFHERVKGAFDKYYADLHEPTNMDLRNKFGRK